MDVGRVVNSAVAVDAYDDSKARMVGGFPIGQAVFVMRFEVGLCRHRHFIVGVAERRRPLCAREFAKLTAMKQRISEDLQVISDPEQVRALSNDLNLDRDFDLHVSPHNRAKIRRMLRIFSLHGEKFPTMCPRTDPVRAVEQDQLWLRLSSLAKKIIGGPAELGPLAEWVRGTGDAEQLGLLVQQSVGRLFVDDFISTRESWAAACVMLEASRSSNIVKMTWWRLTGKLEKAKILLGSMVNGDLSAVNGIGVALHHIVDGLARMRQLANDQSSAQLPVDEVVGKCLMAPSSVVRRANADGVFRECPFRKGSLFILSLGAATKNSANRDLVFLSESWSRCPADRWVPALLEGVWRRARSLEIEKFGSSRG